MPRQPWLWVSCRHGCGDMLTRRTVVADQTTLVPQQAMPSDQVNSPHPLVSIAQVEGVDSFHGDLALTPARPQSWQDPVAAETALVLALPAADPTAVDAADDDVGSSLHHPSDDAGYGLTACQSHAAQRSTKLSSLDMQCCMQGG